MAMNVKVSASQFDEAMQNIIEDYAQEVTESVPEVVDRVAEQGKKLLKSYVISAGIGGKKYKNSFRIQKGIQNAYYSEFILKSDEYRLTHLLEKGHAKRNQYGSYTGTTKAFPHWAPAEAETNKLLEDEIIKTVQKIG